MCVTNSTCLDSIGASHELTTFPYYHCAVCDADSSLDDLIVTSLEAALLRLGAMSDTHSTPNELLVTSHELAPFPYYHRAVRDTHASSLAKSVTSVEATSRTRRRRSMLLLFDTNFNSTRCPCRLLTLLFFGY